MGFEDEVEQSFGRPCRQTNGRFKRTYELTSSIVPRGTSFHRAVELACSPVRLDPARLSCCCGSLPGPAELGAVNPDAMHDHGQPARQRHDCLLHPAIAQLSANGLSKAAKDLALAATEGATFRSMSAFGVRADILLYSLLASDAVDDAMPHSICLRFARYTSRSFLNMAKHHLRSAIGRFMCASVSGVLASAILIISPIILRR